VTSCNFHHPSIDSIIVKAMGFDIPRKRILSNVQLTAFQSSNTHNAIVSYVEVLNDSVIGVKLTDEVALSPVRLWLGLGKGRDLTLRKNSELPGY